jgi:RNA polymerase sigma-70 factor (ECF subfamily)
MDHVGFDAFYRQEHARVLGVVVALTARTDLAADAADEAFARALARWSRVSKMASPGAWTAKVALNVVRRSIRRATRERSLLVANASVESTPASDLELWALVRALPPRQRTAVVLRYVGDFTHTEIAHAMHVRPGTVGSTRRGPSQPARAPRHRGGRDPWMSSNGRVVPCEMPLPARRSRASACAPALVPSCATAACSRPDRSRRS